MNIIEVKNAFKQFKSKSENVEVMCNLNMNVKRGEIYSLMGSSGCGKTTLISCIVDNLKLDRGEIKVFGECSSKFPSLRVGFMPQEIALMDKFKVKETFWFFGRIYGLNVKKIKEKEKFLTEMLKLPPSDRFIKNCSGGQQRRISFAVTLVHDPELLILDEPTVGVDPLLRARIWDYLVELTQTKNTTILMSTHYIEEARQSNQIGLMRNGVLIIEDSPQRIMQANETTDMEVAFLKLSQKQESSEKKVVNQEAIEDGLSCSQNLNVKFEEPKRQQGSPMSALLFKHYLQFVRNPPLYCVTFFLPILTCIVVYFCAGDKIHGLKLGVVNQEIQNINDCFNSSLKFTELHDSECNLEKTSCMFIKNFDQNVAELKFYSSIDEAQKEVRKTSIIGFILFPKNFTETLLLFKEDDAENTSNQQESIQVFMDNTYVIQVLLVQKELYKNFERYMSKLMIDCGKTERAGKIPIQFEAAFGNINSNVMQTIANAMVVDVAFFFTAALMSTTILDEKSSGLWNRVLIAGVRPNQFLVSHIIEGIVVNITIITGLCTFEIVFIAEVRSWNSIILTILILYLTGIFGIFFGICSSVVWKTVASSMYFLEFFSALCFNFSGTVWPIEGLSKISRRFGYMVPVTLPSIAMRSIATKDSTFKHKDVQHAFLALISWICFLIIIIMISGKRK